jgi:hypothetical protein
LYIVRSIQRFELCLGVISDHIVESFPLKVCQSPVSYSNILSECVFTKSSPAAQKAIYFMQAFFPSHETPGQPAVWAAPIDIAVVSHSPADALPDLKDGSMPDPHKEGLRARNRVAAKKWRIKKAEQLSVLEAINDSLRREALALRKQALGLQTENQILEEELKFFQSCMNRIMTVAPAQPGLRGLHRKRHT